MIILIFCVAILDILLPNNKENNVFLKCLCLKKNKFYWQRKFRVNYFYNVKKIIQNISFQSKKPNVRNQIDFLAISERFGNSITQWWVRIKLKCIESRNNKTKLNIAKLKDHNIKEQIQDKTESCS